MSPRKTWGGRRAGQTGRPRKWPEGSVRKPVSVPPDVNRAVEFVQAAHAADGMTWNEALVALARHGARAIEGGGAELARAVLAGGPKRGTG